jgi:hypothetical protein
MRSGVQRISLVDQAAVKDSRYNTRYNCHFNVVVSIHNSIVQIQH